MVDKVRNYIEQHNLIQKKDRIVLGISGGADSVCLLFVLLELKEQYELEIIGVHVNHNIRGEDALHDQKFVERLCEKQGIACETVSVKVLDVAASRGQSVEEAGRDIRREVLEDIRKKYKADKIALAHHSNDNVETFLMNMARGAGLGGLKGMEPIQHRWIRPLLVVERKEVEQYLERIKEGYCTDYTNMENDYTRNRIRNQVLPILEMNINAKTVSHMNQAIEELRKVDAYLREQVESAIKLCALQKDEGQIVIHKERLERYSQVIQERVVKRTIETVAGQQKDITRRHVESVCELLGRQVGRKLDLPYNLIAKRVYDGIEIYKNVDTVKECLQSQEVMLQIPGVTLLPTGERVITALIEKEKCTLIKETPYTKVFDYDIIKDDLAIRQRQIGDYLVINQKGNRQLLRKYLMNNKIPQEQRASMWMLALKDQILWVIGQRRSAAYEVTKGTKMILEIQITEKEVGGKEDGNS